MNCHFLFLLILSTNGVEGGSDCDFTHESACGDACISQNSYCFCAGHSDTINTLVQDLYCCAPPPWEEPWCVDTGTCLQGEVLNTSQMCHDRCYNDYVNSYNKTIGPQAKFQCGDECVGVDTMCRGYSLCSDKSDVRACDVSLKCVSNNWSYSTLHSLASGHHYCQYHETDNDGKFDNIGRKDETSFDVTTQEVMIDYTSLRYCPKANLVYGLTCGDTCVENYEWCRDDRSFTCTNTSGDDFTSNNPQLCGNFTLWSNYSCAIVTPYWQESGKSGVLLRNLPVNPGYGYGYGYGYVGYAGYPYSGTGYNYGENIYTQTTYHNRCRGTNQHCYYPWYAVLDSFQREGELMVNCSDKSDQIHWNNNCPTVHYYINLYLSLWCHPQYSSYSYYETNCNNGTYNMLYSKHQNEDPHHCQQSCSRPGLGCQACTNQNYFNCSLTPDQNVTYCIHPDLKCDGHPQCLMGEDESLGDCYDIYLERGIINEYATVICTSPIYEVMKIVATPCDGISECANGTDEEGCRNSNYGIFLTFGLVPVIFIVLKLFDFFSRDQEDEQKINLDEDLEVLLERYKNAPDDESIIKSVNMKLLYICFLEDKDTRTKAGVLFYNQEEKLRSETSEIFCRLHTHFDPEVTSMVLDAKFPGCLENNCISLADLLEKLKKYEELSSLFKRVWQLTSYVVDLYKDIFILITMISIAGGIASVLNFPEKFSSVVILFSAVTIIVPLLISCCHLAINNPGVVFNQYQESSTIKIAFMQIGVFLMCFLNPLLIINSYESMKKNVRKLVRNSNSESLSLLNKCRKIQQQYVHFIRIELGLETFYQVAGQILLILLAKTSTATTRGLQQMFDTSSVYGAPTKIIFVCSIIFGLKSCILNQVKGITVEKGFSKMTTEIVLYLWACFASLRRVLSMVVFFIPAMGLLNLLNHWRAEQVPFGPANTDKDLELFNMTERYRWSEIHRWNTDNSDNPTPPPYTIYTGLSLGTTMKLGFAIMAFHFIAVALVKICTVKSFVLENLFNGFVNILENMNVPCPYRDWDIGKGTVEEYKKRYARVNTEMMILYAVTFIVTIITLIPLWWTGMESVFTSKGEI